MSATGTIRATTARQMRALGRRLGRLLQTGDVVALEGPLGAGKTTFAQGLAEGLEVPPRRNVASPTFALVSEHPGRVPFVHADLYRVGDPAELEELGLHDALGRAAVAIEWLDRFPEVAPDDTLRIVIAFAPEGGRLLVLRTGGPRSRELAAGMGIKGGTP